MPGFITDEQADDSMSLFVKEEEVNDEVSSFTMEEEVNDVMSTSSGEEEVDDMMSSSSEEEEAESDLHAGRVGGLSPLLMVYIRQQKFKMLMSDIRAKRFEPLLQRLNVST